jgi:hypothetical protein
MMSEMSKTLYVERKFLMPIIQYPASPQNISPMRITRWYDAYNHLKMALHLLYVAPRRAQEDLSTILLRLTCRQHEISVEQAKALFRNAQKTQPHNNRWYDEIPTLQLGLFMMKELPTVHIKRLARSWHVQFGDLLAAASSPLHD